MKTLINQNEKLKRQFLKLILKLPPERFFGVTTILNVKLSEEDKDKVEETTITNSTLGEDLNAPDSIKDNDSSEDAAETVERKDKARNAIAILDECLDKFEALSIQQKKTLLKLIKAGV